MADPTSVSPDSEAPGSLAIQTSRRPSPWTSAGLKQKIEKLAKQFDAWDQRLRPRKEQIRTWTKRFLHDHAAFDKRTEKERATRPFLLDPHVYTNVMAMSTHLLDQFMSSAPQIKVLGRGYEDQGDAALERVQQYDLCERNPAPLWVGSTLRRGAVAGLAINRLRWVEKRDRFKYVPDQFADAEFDGDVEASREEFGPPPTEPGAFEEWRRMVRAKSGRAIRPPAIEREISVMTDVGPTIDAVNPDDFVWDPDVEIEDGAVWYRTFPRRDTLLALAKAYPDVWDADAIRRLPKESSRGERSGSDLRKATLEALGVTPGDDPYSDDIVMLRQRWAPREPELRYVAIGNEGTPLTRDPEHYPFIVGRHPFFSYYNVPTDYASIGISEYQPNGGMSDWLDNLQSVQLFWMALRAFTPMAVMSGSNLKEKLESALVPLGIIELDDFDDVRPLFEKFNAEPQFAEQWLASCRNAIDRATGINEMTRGEPATVNRVTGYEIGARQGAMQARMKDRLYRFGVTMSRMARFNAVLRYQFGKREDLVNIAGLDPFTSYNPETFWHGMQTDYVFTPASASAEASLQAQQVVELIKMLGGMGALVPGGQLMVELVMRALQAMRVPGAGEAAKMLKGDINIQTQLQQAAQQTQQLQQQLAAVQKENDALRKKLTPPVPPAQELQAELDALGRGPAQEGESGAGAGGAEAEQAGAERDPEGGEPAPEAEAPAPL